MDSDRKNDQALSWRPDPSSWALVAIAWLAVGLPLAWGIWNTIEKASVLLR